MQNIFASKYNLLYRLGCIFQGYKYNNNILSSFYSVSTNLPLELLELLLALNFQLMITQISILLIPSDLHTIQLLNDIRELIQIINLQTKLNTHILYESFHSMSRLLLDCFALMLSVNNVMKVFKSK